MCIKGCEILRRRRTFHQAFSLLRHRELFEIINSKAYIPLQSKTPRIGNSHWAILPTRKTSDPSVTAKNEQNNKPWTVPLVPGDWISDIIWRGSICLGVLYLIHKYVVKISSQGS